MEKTTIHLHSKIQVDQVDPRIFGGFLEHMGRAVYEGVYDPESKHADENGFRKDVLEALKRLKMTVVRYPGGNFVSGYHWEDGVGPRENRPTVRDLAWNSIETNMFGTDEFIKLCRKMNWSPMMSINLGTGTPEEGRNWVEYCNGPKGTKYADMRVQNGSPDPFDVKLWCLGNEMDAEWQLGHVPAREYAIRAQQASKLMKDFDRSLEMVVCGSCNVDLPTYMAWDREVLEYVASYADYISSHRYVGNENNDTADFLAVTNSIDKQIEETAAVCRYTQAKNKQWKRVAICFDEWNVWYRNHEVDGNQQIAPHLIEEVYNLEDALVAAGFLNSFIRHADTVKIANIAQIVNIIAPLLTKGDDLLVQSIYYPFEMMSRRKNGVSLKLSVEGPEYSSPSYGSATTIDASTILSDHELHVFTVNRSLNKTAEIHIHIADREIVSLNNAEVLTGPDAKAANSFEIPDGVVSQPFDSVTVKNGKAVYEIPALSFAAVSLNLK
jgi:alpha-N-arabinofuranosidase